MIGDIFFSTHSTCSPFETVTAMVRSHNLLGAHGLHGTIDNVSNA